MLQLILNMVVYENCCQNLLTLSQMTEFLDVPAECTAPIVDVYLIRFPSQKLYYAHMTMQFFDAFWKSVNIRDIPIESLKFAM